MLTNDVVSFEQLGPDHYYVCYERFQGSVYGLSKVKTSFSSKQLCWWKMRSIFGQDQSYTEDNVHIMILMIYILIK